MMLDLERDIGHHTQTRKSHSLQLSKTYETAYLNMHENKHLINLILFSFYVILFIHLTHNIIFSCTTFRSYLNSFFKFYVLPISCFFNFISYLCMPSTFFFANIIDYLISLEIHISKASKNV